MGVIFYKYFFTMSRTIFYLHCPRATVGEMYRYGLIKIQNEIWVFHEDACDEYSLLWCEIFLLILQLACCRVTQLSHQPLQIYKKFKNLHIKTLKMLYMFRP